LIDEINDLKSNRDYWKERALHQKHSNPVKQVESEWYECLTSSYYNFRKGHNYIKLTNYLNINMCWMINDKGNRVIVERKYFKPVVK